MDHPIIFSAPMIAALLAGRKTQTRRLAWRDAPQNSIRRQTFDGGKTWLVPSPWQRVQPGARLYVRESAFILGRWRQDGVTKTGRPKLRFAVSPQRKVIYADHPLGPGQQIMGASGNMRVAAGEGYWLRPSIHMPRWASRLTLTITGVRVQRLQEISEADAEAEGITATGPSPGQEDALYAPPHCGAVENFADLWNHLHGPGAWDANPEVVAISFTAAQQNIDRNPT